MGDADDFASREDEDEATRGDGGGGGVLRVAVDELAAREDAEECLRDDDAVERETTRERPAAAGGSF